MGRVDDEVLKSLEAADWDKIILDLIHFSQWRARRYKWRSGNLGQLPGGKTPKDIALDAILKVFQGQRAWDPEKYPDLLTHLKWIVKSDLNHLFASAEHMTTERINELEDRKGSELTYNDPISDPLLPLSGPVQTPEDQLLAKERVGQEEMVKQGLFELVKGDEDLELLLSCFEEGMDKADQIAEEMSWDLKKVYNLKRKLLRKASVMMQG